MNNDIVNMRWQEYHSHELQFDYCNRGHLDHFDQSDYRKITIYAKKGCCGPISSL